MMTGVVVLKMLLIPSRQRRPSLANSGARGPSIGVSVARRTRSGSGVGPGICRKWRPGRREEFFDIGFPSILVQFAGRQGGGGRGGRAASGVRGLPAVTHTLDATQHI